MDVGKSHAATILPHERNMTWEIVDVGPLGAPDLRLYMLPWNVIVLKQQCRGRAHGTNLLVPCLPHCYVVFGIEGFAENARDLWEALHEATLYHIPVETGGGQRFHCFILCKNTRFVYEAVVVLQGLDPCGTTLVQGTEPLVQVTAPNAPILNRL